MSRRTVPFAVACSALLLAVGVVAQEKKEKKGPKHERLQPYWNTLDLTEDQLTSYDRVVRKYKPKIEELEDQLDKLKETRRKEWHAILTPSQAKKLEASLAARGKNKKEKDEDAADEKGSKKPTEEVPEKKPTKKPSSKKPPKTKPADDK